MNTMAESVATVLSTADLAETRHAVRAVLDGLHQPAMAAEAADTVVLVVFELVTNAVRHGGGTGTLELTSHAESIEVTVHDSTAHAPRFGWPMVNRLARATAVTRRASGGKTDSALFDR
ncbi:hypothetical protein OV450_7069 [Actinobacteria bacterium OV450]|nr:hypothetical protein OV450_7069 [Actinobacteria bacterium OV450]